MWPGRVHVTGSISRERPEEGEGVGGSGRAVERARYADG